MVSVCMATFNGGKYVREQVNSILAQLSDGDELIVSDDGSTDDTLEVLKSFHDSRIKVFAGPHKGVTYNFENAISCSEGEYIILSDQDDVWEPNKVERMLTALSSHDLVVSDGWIADEGANSTGRSIFDFNPPHGGFVRTVCHTSYMGCCMAFRRRILERVMPFPPHIIGHDYWIGQIADMYYDTCFISDRLFRYRRHGNNASSFTTNNSPLSFRQKVVYRFWLVWYALGRGWRA